jgi:hypothetical protein
VTVDELLELAALEHRRDRDLELLRLEVECLRLRVRAVDRLPVPVDEPARPAVVVPRERVSRVVLGVRTRAIPTCAACGSQGHNRRSCPRVAEERLRRAG